MTDQPTHRRTLFIVTAGPIRRPENSKGKNGTKGENMKKREELLPEF